MKLNFYGADQCVTGSCHCLEVNGKNILIDCGLQQGRDEVNNEALPFHPGSIDFVLITHAHIDHTGRVPMLVKQGFQGRILTTRVTANLMDIMLLDSAHIQESDAEWKNRKAARSGAPKVEPLYTIEDAENVKQYVTTCEYGEDVELCEGVSVRFDDAGHLLGSACITVTATENGVTKKLIFSGDLGNVDQPIIRDPSHFGGADYVIMESTYGNRNHTEVWSYTEDLAKIIDDTMAKGGNVVIPAFAVGRTQELLYFIREIKDKGLGEVQPGFPGLHRLASGPPCHHHLHRRSGRLSGCRRAGAGAGRHPHVQLLQPPHDGDGGGIQGAERGRHSQGHHLRLRYVRRGPDPSPPEAQPLEAGVHHRVRGLSGGGHAWAAPCWRASEV